jgi:hypothetical protein
VLAAVLRRLTRASASRWFRGGGGEWLLLAGVAYLVTRTRRSRRRAVRLPIRAGEQLLVQMRDPRG